MSERHGKRRPSTLFHGTGIEQLAAILADGFMAASDPDDHDTSGVSGVSFTSCRDVARKFADEAKERDWEGRWDSPVDDGAVLEFDAALVEAAAGLVGVSWDGSSSEREYRTLGHLPGVAAHLRSVSLDAEACRWWIEALRDAGEDAAADALARLPAALVSGLRERADAEPGATLGDILGAAATPGPRP